MLKQNAMQLPAFKDYESFNAWRLDTARSLPAALDIARSHGLSSRAPHVFVTGSNFVVGLDDRLILKIFPPLLRRQFVSERGALSALCGRLTVTIPEIVVEGERDGWPYLVITRVPGALGKEAWPQLTEAQKECVLFELGTVIAEVQRAPVGALAEIEPRWDVLMREQIAGCRARHARLGLAQKFLDDLDNLLRDAAVLIPIQPPAVILTGEYIPENLLLDIGGEGCRLGGVIDFGDVMTGWREYDLMGPSAFMAAGRPRRVRSLFDGYGYSRADINFEMKRRLMALLMLHRFSDPIRHVCIENWQDKADNFVELQELIWPDE
jgi:hygromycin-B 7''-O-kinase